MTFKHLGIVRPAVDCASLRKLVVVGITRDIGDDDSCDGRLQL